MRKSFAVLILAVGVLVGYALHTVPVKEQVPPSERSAFNIGESVTLFVDMPESPTSHAGSREYRTGLLDASGR